MATAVRLVVEGLDIDEPRLDPILESFDDVTFGTGGGLTFMTVFVPEGGSVVSVVHEAARKLAHRVPGARAVRVHADLVSTAVIASRIGLSREAVRKWIADARLRFPTHFDTVGVDQRVWRWVEVVEWLLDVKGLDMDEDLPSVSDISHIDAYLGDVPDTASDAWRTLEDERRQLEGAHVRQGRLTDLAFQADFKMEWLAVTVEKHHVS